MDNELDLTALRMFRAVLREGSFSAAAQALRAPKSTVSKRIADLEADLGVRLIERSTRSLRVTAEGEVLAARAERLLGEAEDIRRELNESGRTPRGHLRIAFPVMFGQLLMGGIGARFRALYPEITLECIFLDRPPDLLEEGFDGAVQIGPLGDSGQVTRVLLHTRHVMTAAPGLPGLDSVRHPQELARLPQVGLVPNLSDAWTLISPEGERVTVPVKAGLYLGSLLAVRDAAVAGAGVASLPRLLAIAELRGGRLVRVLPGWATPQHPIQFIYHSTRHATARLRVFLEFLASELHRIDEAMTELDGGCNN